MNAAVSGNHHVPVESPQSVVTKTLPKHLLNRHLTSLVSGGIISQTGCRREDFQSGEAVCLETITIQQPRTARVRPFSPVR